MTPRGRINLRSARDSEARSLYALIAANLEEGHLLPRTLSELAVHATRFVVATRGRRVVGCAELAALSPHVAEVRSLAVDARERGHGVGTLIVEELRRRARAEELMAQFGLTKLREEIAARRLRAAKHHRIRG